MRSFALVLLAAVAVSLPGAALAQTYPVRPIRVLVPWPPGGVSDVLARTVSFQLGEAFGQQLLVENRPGAGGTVGVALAARAAPDGYTLLITDVPSHAISASLYAKLPYAVLEDFEPVAMLAGSPMVLTASPSLSVKTATELIQLVRGHPGRYAYASSGNGSITHLAIERIKRTLNLELAHVPYKGTVPAVASVLAGDTALAFGTIPAVVPHASAGRLVLLGSSFARRFSQISDVPPVADVIPGFDMGFYTALLVPAHTPRGVIDRLNTEVANALAKPKVKEILAASAAEPVPMTPAQLRDYLAAEVRSWREVVGPLGLKGE